MATHGGRDFESVWLEAFVRGSPKLEEYKDNAHIVFEPSDRAELASPANRAPRYRPLIQATHASSQHSGPQCSACTPDTSWRSCVHTLHRSELEDCLTEVAAIRRSRAFWIVGFIWTFTALYVTAKSPRTNGEASSERQSLYFGLCHRYAGDRRGFTRQDATLQAGLGLLPSVWENILISLSCVMQGVYHIFRNSHLWSASVRSSVSDVMLSTKRVT